MLRKLREASPGFVALLVAAVVTVASIAPVAFGQIDPGEGRGGECPPQGQSYTCTENGTGPRCCGLETCITEECQDGQCTCVHSITTYYYVEWP